MQSDAIKEMSSHIPPFPFRVKRWSRRGPAATGVGRGCRAAAALATALALAGPACGGATYRQVRPSEPLAAASGRVSIAVQRVYLTDDTIENGVRDGTALAVELTAVNAGSRPYALAPTALWCLMQLDARHPDQTRMLPPSVNGEGTFPGALPEGDGDLHPIEVAAGETRSFWILFRGYRFDGSEVPRRIALRLPDADGHPFELVLADPAEGLLRWEVPLTRVTWTVGIQGGSLYGSYVQASSFSERVSRQAAAGRFLWDVGLVSSVLVQVEGHLRSTTSSFTGLGLDAHLTLPLLRWGEARDPVRLGPYLGGQIQTLIAIEPTPKDGSKPTPPPVYGQGGPEVGLELDVGALRNAATPFPLSPVGANPLPRWSVRLGYTHTWIGHGTADGYFSGARFAW